MHRRIFVVRFSAVILLLMIAPFSLSAQSYAVLHTFAPGAIQRLGLILTNSEGVNPTAGLALSGSTLYGAAKNGGIAGSGALFAMDTNGANFTVLYSFSSDLSGNSDGANPNGGLVLANNTVYGTTSAGGTGDSGVIFSMDRNTLVIRNLYTFTATDLSTGINSDGANPSAGLVLSGPTLFGTASVGGSGSGGTLFSVATNGANFKVLHQFSAVDATSGTNIDGANPSTQLILAGATLFGTTSAGGSTGYGTAFAINTDGSGFTVLHNFDINSAKPVSELVLSGPTLYGMTDTAVFAINTNGTGFTILHQFSNSIEFVSTATPGLTLVSNTLFGAAAGDGANGTGEVFSMNLNGTGFASQYDFSNESGSFPGTNSDGAFPNGGMVSLNGTLYGATAEGGPSGNGVVFSLTPSSTVQIIPPVLSAQLLTSGFVLSFQTVSGQTYFVEQNVDLATTNWTTYTNLTGDGALAQFTISTTIPQQFFRVRVQ
jgi:uncharacterized repeat protein (TIGR03803 family)